MSSISNNSNNPLPKARAASLDKAAKPADAKVSSARANSLPGNMKAASPALRAHLEQSPLVTLKKEGVTLADLEALPKDLTAAVASVQKSSVPTEVKSSVKKLQAALTKLYQAVVAPALAALAAGGLAIYTIIKTSIKATFLPVVLLAKFFILICSKITGKDFSNAQKPSMKFIAETIMESGYIFDVNRSFKAFNKAIKSGNFEALHEYFDSMKRNVDEVAHYLSMTTEEHAEWQRNL